MCSPLFKEQDFSAPKSLVYLEIYVLSMYIKIYTNILNSI